MYFHGLSSQNNFQCKKNYNILLLKAFVKFFCYCIKYVVILTNSYWFSNLKYKIGYSTINKKNLISTYSASLIFEHAG